MNNEQKVNRKEIEIGTSMRSLDTLCELCLADSHDDVRIALGKSLALASKAAHKLAVGLCWLLLM
jgi:hypothetical protein